MNSLCIDYELLIAYAAQELDASQVAQVREHTAICPGCAGTVARYHWLSAYLNPTVGNPILWLSLAHAKSRATALFRLPTQ